MNSMPVWRAFALCRFARVAMFLVGVLGTLMVRLSQPAYADISSTPAAQTAEATRYQNYLTQAATLGPAQVSLSDQAILQLPAQFAFLPAAPAKAFMQRLGNATDANFLGLVMPWQESNWFIMLEFIPSGYVADDDAKNWDADELLKSVRENTDKANLQRKQQGVPELEILGWAEKPHYDTAAHRLVWSISARDKGGATNGQNIVNYKMLALGRQGYLSLVMVTDASSIADQKSIANGLLARVTFNSGKRYADFNSSTDHVAEYGLAALIGGVVVHKLGFFALLAAFAAKAAKFIAVAAVGAFAALRRIFRRPKPVPAAATTATATPSAPMDQPPVIDPPS